MLIGGSAVKPRGRYLAKSFPYHQACKNNKVFCISSKDICGGMISSSPRDLPGTEDQGKALWRIDPNPRSLENLDQVDMAELKLILN